MICRERRLDHTSLSLAQHSVNTLWGIAMATGCYGWYDTTTHSSGRWEKELHNKSQECKQGTEAIILISEWTEGPRLKVEKTYGYRQGAIMDAETFSVYFWRPSACLWRIFFSCSSTTGKSVIALHSKLLVTWNVKLPSTQLHTCMSPRLNTGINNI